MVSNEATEAVNTCNFFNCDNAANKLKSDVVLFISHESNQSCHKLG